MRTIGSRRGSRPRIREEYLQNVPGRNGNLIEGKNDTLNWDVSASFNLTEQISLTFEGLNLTDEENHQYVGDDSRQSTSVYHHTGRQYYRGRALPLLEMIVRGGPTLRSYPERGSPGQRQLRSLLDDDLGPTSEVTSAFFSAVS